ncbi:DUF4097 family beta strand repeat-containing protein [Radiobacillus deserti]|uniref:DUF4097 domain-containing protein n=1 Tax=Radiobacillus deserti TaxID=2594883 RepID=A0A516KK16_9BACI|nr:DUF4097 family beta strand repeat-containing protein [Radiobacillus deserti]QDP41743.1 DUF4097 domain-containing protein [Radiobacillus deserti]
MKKVALIAAVLFVLGLVGVFTTYATGDHFLTGGDNTDISETKSFDSGSVERVNVNVDVGEVIVSKSQTDQIEVRVQTKKLRKEHVEYSMKQTDDTIDVIFDKSDAPWYAYPIFSFQDRGSIVEVKLPDKEFKSITMESNVGEVRISNIKTKELIAYSDVGDMTINQVVAAKSTLHTDVGEIEVNAGTGAFSIESDTGEVSLELDSFVDDVKINSNVGEISVSLRNEPENFTFDLASDVGEVSVNGFSSIPKSSGKSYYVEQGNGNPILQVKTDVGEIEIEKD